jgi:uncharacterized protein YdhG (YjbR/CyaY superfamily)
MKKTGTIDEYLSRVSAEHCTALEKLRQTIKSAAPGAEECLSYGLAAFRLNGRPLVAFGVWSDHCSLYPMSSRTVKTFQDQLKDYRTSKGTIHFHADKPLPAALVRKLIKARIAENRVRSAGAQLTASQIRSRMKPKINVLRPPPRSSYPWPIDNINQPNK